MTYKSKRKAPHFPTKLSSDFGKKVGILIKKDSESLIFTGLKIPGDYYRNMEEQETTLQSKIVIFENVRHCVNMNVPQKYNKVRVASWESKR